MFRLFSLLAFALSSCLFAQSSDPQAGLSVEQVRSLIQSVELDARTRTAMNAVTSNDIKSIAMNRDVLAASDDIFSFKLETKGITDQEGSGRCWMFAGANLMRQDVSAKYDLDEFEFSESYFAFHDLLEKSNVFLEYIIATRDRDIQDRELVKHLEDPIGDGGYWGFFANLMQKYGVVPKNAMSETRSSANTGTMQRILAMLMRRDAAHLRTLGAEGRSLEELRAEKARMLKDVTRLLVINYGVPPTEFEWRTTDSTGRASDPETFTPQEFFRNVVDVDLADFVSLANYPIHPFSKNYSIQSMQPMADKNDVTFVNIDAATMKDITLKALMDSNRIWFACDVGHESYSKKGLLIEGMYNYEELFGIELGMSKEVRLDYRDQSANHAMVLVGVDVVDGKPRKWLVENSWGKERGDGGLFTMSDEWFDEYVLNVIIPSRYLPKELLRISKEPPTPLPIWDPVWDRLELR